VGAGAASRRDRWTTGRGPGTFSPALLAGELVVLVAYLSVTAVIERNPFAAALLDGASPAAASIGWGLPEWMVLLWLVTIVMLATGGAYRQRLNLSVWEELPALGWRAVAALTMVAAAVDRVSGGPARSAVLIFGAAGLVSHLGVRLGVTSLLRDGRAGRRTLSRTLVLGGGTLSFKAVELLESQPELGLLVLGYVDDFPAPLSYGPEGWTYLGQVADLAEVVQRLGIQTVLVGFGAGSDGLAAQALCRLSADPFRPASARPAAPVWPTGTAPAERESAAPQVQIFAVPRLFELGRRPLGQDHVGPIPLTRVRPASRRGPRWALKRALDVVAAVVALVALSPLLAVLALAVRVECGRGPVVVRRNRVGRRGAALGLWQFRTARAGRAPGWVARRLRHSWPGRLPVLWNLLVGDVSVIGPRPVTPLASQRLQRMLPHYEHRLQVRSGLIGPGATSPCRGEPPADEAVLYDTAYVENWGLWTDATVLLHGLRRLVRRAVPGVRA
jgi:lipopolysaccharide/colanic/teichoic acid biosynthesis glycosyltransferase